MSSRAYYRWFPGEFLRSAGHLTLIEQGAYRALLDRYYTLGPLPIDREGLHRIAGAHTEKERAAVDAVVKMFFVEDGDLLRQNRADKEIRSRAELIALKSEQGRRGGLKSAAARWGADVSGRLSERSTGRSSEGVSERVSETISNHIHSKTTSARRTLAVDRIYADPDFTQFWKAYPRKKDKSDAAIAWDNLNGTRPETSVILAAIEWQRKCDDWKTPKYIPYPATWLNARRWEDEAPEVTHDKPLVY